LSIRDVRPPSHASTALLADLSGHLRQDFVHGRNRRHGLLRICLRDHTPHNAQLLADPGHAWRFGTSLRVSAERDVFIEDVKDIAIGMYDRTVAMRNMERRSALGDWVSLTPAQFQNLAARYDLQYLVSDQVEPFDEVYHNARFHVYRLK